MANLPQESTWEEGIYQLEETDVVRGGPVEDGGISNMQAQQLGNRTKYLYDRLGRKAGVIVDAVNGSIAIESKDLLDMHHVLNVTASGSSVTLNADELPDGAEISITVMGSGFVHLVPKAGMSFVGLPDTLGTGDLPIYVKETLTLIKNEATLIVIDAKMQLEEVGEIIYRPKAPQLALPASGQLVNRADVPRLWALVSSIAVSDSDWVLNGLKYLGRFSSGNGATTMRMPDLRGMFLRGLDNGAGRDLDRLYSGEGGGQVDAFKRHSHEMSFPELPNHQPGNPGYDGGNNQYWVDYTKATTETGGVETRPMNVAYTAYIKY